MDAGKLSKGEEKMEEKEKGKGANPVSRRDFIKGAGLVLGGVAAGAAAGTGVTLGLTPPEEVKEVEVVKEVVKEVLVSGVLEPAFEPEHSVIRGTSSMGFGRDGTPTRVEVKNGKIVRIRPVRYAEEGYGPEYQKPWKIEVRGEVLEPSYKKVLTTPLGLSYKKRVYSPNRIRYPLRGWIGSPEGSQRR
jgi:anaerobic selenocysteine-containing dehydrogenase